MSAPRQMCWKYDVLCGTDAFQWLMNHQIFDKHVIALLMDYCGDSALSTIEWINLMETCKREQSFDLIHFTPVMTDSLSISIYDEFFLSLENEAPMCISFSQDDFTHVYISGNLFYIQLTELATQRFIQLAKKLVDQFIIQNYSPCMFSTHHWYIDYGNFSTVSFGSFSVMSLILFNLSALQVYVSQVTPNLITYHEKPHFIPQVRQVLFQKKKTDIHFTNQVSRVCVRISDIYIKDLCTAGIQIELSTLELYHDKIPTLTQT